MAKGKHTSKVQEELELEHLTSDCSCECASECSPVSSDCCESMSSKC